MITKIQKWINRQRLRTPLRRLRSRYDLRELVGRIYEHHEPEELEWGLRWPGGLVGAEFPLPS